MKTLKNILTGIGISALLLSSCSDEWDSHYSQQEQEFDVEGLTVINGEILDYLSSTAEYSSMYNLLDRTGILDSMKTRDQIFTVLTVDNQLLQVELDDEKYTAMSFISDLAFSPANMANGQRILMWNGKYLTITIDDNGTIAFNGSQTVKIIKLNDGYLYEINSIVNPPKSLIEHIQGLSDEYSMFRDSVLKYNAREFDRENSLPIGVDATGSTVYDTIWITTNSFFANAGFDIFSEANYGTVLIPFNDIVLASWAHAEERMKKWNLTDIPEMRPDSIARQFFYKVGFFNTALTLDQLNNGEEDLKSIFDSSNNKTGIRHIWRPGVQKVYTDQTVELSNATVYYVSYLQTPINTLIWRIKDFFWNYNNLRYEQKQEYYTFENLDEPIDDESGWLSSVTWTVDYARWMEGGMYSNGVFTCKTAQYKILDLEYTNQDGNVYVLDFKPYHFHWDANQNPAPAPYLIPPGTYNFAMALQQDARHAIDIYINGEPQASLAASSTDWNNYNYDRYSNGLYPFGYTGNDSKYGHDGGPLGVVTFTEEEGTPITITIVCTDLSGSTKPLPLYAWTLTPTEDCY
ncbi:MAG: hypothetical protein LUD68_03805 [Rikenellaceae bacterium]|nr:hypothetical protein [Rikenellaceae bacterium]